MALQPGTSLTINLPITQAYQSGDVTLSPQTVAARIDLTEREHLFKSEKIPVGKYKTHDVYAQLEFWYKYDITENKITLRGNDDKSDVQLSITSFSGDTPGLGFRHTPNDIAQPANLWADYVQHDAKLAAAMKSQARQCNQLLVDGLIEAGISAVLELRPPPVVTPENLDAYRGMFGDEIASNAPLDVPSEIKLLQLRVNSVYGGNVTWASNAQFANVIGSTTDPRPSKYASWIDMWATEANSGSRPTQCTSLDFFSNDPSKKCSTDFVGGHVVTGQTPTSPTKGSTVYLYPICKIHNGNNSCYMEVKENPTGVQLNNYMQ
jgi:hypothetical protein